jgi:large subunit ribosomal protein L23
MKNSHDILIAPWFSEKALILTEKGVYTFAVPKGINKFEIAKAVKEIYKITPRAVRIVNLPGARVSQRSRRGVATRAKRRKAYVYLKKGDTIQFA